MVKVNNFNPSNAQATGFNQNQAQFTDPLPQNQSQFNQASQDQAQPTEKKSLISIPPALMQIVPWIPIGLEMLTGQKIPQIGGTIGEIQASLSQMQFSLTQILNNQQQLWVKLESLEAKASSQLVNLSQQVASTNKSFHILATETKKSLEFNPRPQLERHPETEYQ